VREAQPNCPPNIQEYARQTLEYVESALDFTLDYTGETLPVLDHYLKTVPREEESIIDLVSYSAGAYFGEVVRRELGGQWLCNSGDPNTWRFVLPTGIAFSPPGLVGEAICLKETDEHSASFYFPQPLIPHLEVILGRMAEVTEEVYYSLSGRMDTLQHIEDVLIAIAAKKREEREEREKTKK